MKIGVTIRNMGEQSTAELINHCAVAAEAGGWESLWITDHIAIPPDDAEGSGGRYLDPLITLAWLANATRTIKLATGVLILPYRPALPTAKQIATLQTLCGERLILGVGIGWMDAEFRALGLDRHQRGRASDATLAFLNEAFANDEVTLNGQRFLFKPRPRAPEILIGGRAPHALTRALRYGDGWLPMVRTPEQLRRDLQTYEALAEAQGQPRGSITVMTGLPLEDISASRDRLNEYAALGVDRLVCAMRYENLSQYQQALDALAAAHNGSDSKYSRS